MFKRQLIFWVTFLHCSTHLQTRTRSLFKCFLEWEKIGNQVEVRAGSHGKGRSKNSYFSFFLDAFIIRASFWSVLSTLFIWKWPFSNPTKYTLFAPKALSTLPRCPRNASIDSRPHYRFNAFSTVLTRTSENAPVIFSVTVFIFDTFSIVHTITNVCVFVLITFKSVFKLIRFKRKHISTLCSNFIQNFVRGRGVGGKQSVLWRFENREYAPWFLGSYNNSKNGVKILGTG